MKIGEIIADKSDIIINEGKAAIEIQVKNTSTRPIQIGSHFHFFEVNSALDFDRKKAYGYRLDIAAGTAIRFQPQETKTVCLVELGGERKVMGASGAVNNYLDKKREEVLNALKEDR